MISQSTIDCALSALRVAHDSLNAPSVHFSVEVQRAHQAEIRDAVTELERAKATLKAHPEGSRWTPVEDGDYGEHGDLHVRKSGRAVELADFWEYLPNDIRLCRLQPGQAAAMPAGARATI